MRKEVFMSIIFFDIDGTIMDANGGIPSSAILTIRQLRSRGHLCIINTGRPYIDLDPSLFDIGFDGLICTCGQHIIFHGKELLCDGFSPAASTFLMELGRKCRMDMYYESKTGVWLERYDTQRELAPELLLSLSRFVRRGISVTSPQGIPGFHFDKLCISYTQDSLLSEFLTGAAPYCEPIDRGGGMYELPKKGYSKGTGCRFMANALHIPLEDCFAIGDSTNDVSMLECVGHPLVMGTAPRSVQQIAEYVTDALAADGLYHAMRHTGLIP